MYEKGYRTVTYSRTEATHLLRYVDINGRWQTARVDR